MVELQAADEAKEEAGKAAETAVKTPQNTTAATETPTETPTEHPVKPLDAKAQRMLDLLPHLPEVITDMGNTSAVGQGWQFVFKTTENKYGVRLGKLAGEVYAAWTTSKGSEDPLKHLIEQYAPRQMGPQTPPSTPSSTPQSTPTTPQGPNSSTNPAQLPNGVLAGVLRGVLEGVLSSSSTTPEVLKGVLAGVFQGVLSTSSTSPDGVLDIVERNRKLSDEEAISGPEFELGIGLRSVS